MMQMQHRALDPAGPDKGLVGPEKDRLYLQKILRDKLFCFHVDVSFLRDRGEV